MNKKLITRAISFFTALLMLVSSASLVVSASAKDNTTSKTVEEYSSKLSTIGYDEYVNKCFTNAAKLNETYKFDVTKNWTYKSLDGSIVITMVNDVWKMQVGDTTYNTLDEALAAKDANNNALYEKTELCYVETYDNVKAIYTPDTGSITWKLDVKTTAGCNSATLCSIAFDYYPIAAKATSIEREFYINNEVPFAEARALTISKLWKSFQQEGGEKLAATYELSKKEIKANAGPDIEKAAKDIGLDATFVAENNTLVVYQPDVVTSEICEFVEKYELRFFVTDITKNEIRPAQVQSPEWATYVLRDGQGYDFSTTDYTSDYFGFVITPNTDGEVNFTLDGVNEPMAISSIQLLPYTNMETYADYYERVKNAVGETEGTDTIKLEGEMTTRTSTNVVYPVEDRTSAYTSPADTKRTVLNTIGTEKWETAGQWVEYEFSVNESGFYNIYTRFRQSYLDGMYVSRSLKIYTNYSSETEYMAANHTTNVGYYNGCPFSEASRLRYNYSSDWQVTSLVASTIVEAVNEDGLAYNTTSDTKDMRIYFEAGVVYTIRLEVTLGSMSTLVQQIEDVLNSLNNDYLTILKLTGTTPDDYRDYNFARLLPDTLIDMIRQAGELDKISEFLKESAGVASTYSGICDKLSNLLKRMALDEDDLAKNLDNFKSYVGSLGTFLTDSKTQPLQIDYITIQPSDVKAPKAKPNIFVAFWHEMSSFIQSFFRDYNSMGAMESNEGVETIKIWLPYGRDQATVIRNLATNDFTQQYNIAVDLKLVSGGTLLPSILAGMGPDAYIGIGQETVINYAIRGALSNIEGMEGFDEILGSAFDESATVEYGDFNEAAWSVLRIADADGDMHYYGLPETQSFPMMFLRYDILANLDIEIPKTWEDIYIAQSKLSANNMQIGVTTDYKIFLYQMGSDLWADEGMRINLDSTIGLEAFNKMCDMFTQYSFPYTYDAANRFRTGEMPIIISDYTGLYNKLKVFATELDGCWTFVPLPGITHDDGNGNTYVDNASISTVTAVVMIESDDTEAKAKAWKFMCWQTGAECQANYANEMVAIIGDSAKHATANRTALKSLPWTHEEYVEVSKQFENLASVNNYPGYYYIGRYTDFAFLAAYNNDADPSTEILSYINTINNEITRKRKEFGLETLEIGETLAVKRETQALAAMSYLQKKYNSTAYEEAVQTAKYGIANDKPIQMEEAASIFMDLCETKWAENGSTTYMYTKVNGEQIEKPSYYKNIGKQTEEAKNGGYNISSLDENQLLYFISVCLQDAAKALRSY